MSGKTCLARAGILSVTLVLSGAAAASQAISVSEDKPLAFGNVIAGFTQDIVINAGDAGAAVFSATGDPNISVTAEVVEKKITMQTPSGAGHAARITVSGWSYGGSLSSKGGGYFDGSGQLSNIRVGATARVRSSDVEGFYIGSATFRLVYQ